MRLDFLHDARRDPILSLSLSLSPDITARSAGSRERRRAASNIQDFTDGVSHACHTSRYTGSPNPRSVPYLSNPNHPRAGGSASHLADLATARVEHPPLFRALDVFRVP